jgi:hypothetical protein
MHSIVKKAKEYGCKSVVLDLDNTCYKEDAGFAESIGKGFLRREAERFHMGNVLTGLWNYAKIKANHRLNHKNNGTSPKNLEILFNTLGKTRIADMVSAYEFARKHRDNKELIGFGDFIQDCKDIGSIAISTGGVDIGPAVVIEKYPVVSGYAANPVIYEWNGVETSNEPIVHLNGRTLEGELDWIGKNPMISGCDMKIISPEDKRNHTEKLLNKLGSSLEEALVIFDDHHLDSLVVKNSCLAATSPLATPESKKMTKYHIESYVA